MSETVIDVATVSSRSGIQRIKGRFVVYFDNLRIICPSLETALATYGDLKEKREACAI